MSRTYVALDLETTGLDPRHDSIIEIGAVRFRGEQVLDTWSTLVRPQRSVSFRIVQLTGINPVELSAAAPLDDAIKELQRFVGPLPIVAHSAPQDLRFVQRSGGLLANHAIDTFELASILLPGTDRYSLERLVSELGLERSSTHRALDDAHAHMQLFLALFERACGLNRHDLRVIANLAARTDWPLQIVFADAVERQASLQREAGAVHPQVRPSAGRDAAAAVAAPTPAPTRVPLDVSNIESLIAPGGGLARDFAGYEDRPQQREMLRHVCEAFNHGQHVLVEAGTGVGKSLAYLLPSVCYSLANGRQVVVSTNTINLQDQLLNQDLPTVARLVDKPFRAAALKGRSNYVCLSRLAALRQRQDLDTASIRALAKLLAWLPTTQTGDRAEVLLQPDEEAVWRQVSAGDDACTPDHCAYARVGQCFWQRARAWAEAAHIIVINHALLLSDLQVENRVLPHFEHLIVDEAHHLDDVATDQLGFDVGLRDLEAVLWDLARPGEGGLLRELAGLGQRALSGEVAGKASELALSLAGEVEAAHVEAYRLWRALESFVQGYAAEDQGLAETRPIRLTSGIRMRPGWTDVEVVWEDLGPSLAQLVSSLTGLVGALADSDLVSPEIEPGAAHVGLAGADLISGQVERILGGLVVAHRRTGMLHGQLRRFIDAGSDGEVYWLEQSGSPRREPEVRLRAAPLEVGPLLSEKLFGDKETVVLTSATLRAATPDRDGFAFLQRRLGLEHGLTYGVESPFDYAASTLLFLPTDMPEPGQPNYQKCIQQALIGLCSATRGRTLVLFTSHAQLQTTYYGISGALGERGIGVLGQGLDGSRTSLLERLKDLERDTVLLGTRSFWEGIDVPGRALSCVVVVRLPFDVPTDPVFAARSEALDNPFDEYALPLAVLRLRQGFGRLIRTQHDRGVVAILDRRVQTKAYGRAFLDALPPAGRHSGPLDTIGQVASKWLSPEGEVAR